MRADKAYAPHIEPASARIVDTTELKEKIRLGAVDLFRNHDLPADGTFLEPGDAFVMSAAGCPIIIAADRYGRYVVVAHAGRDSLIDRGAVVGEPTEGRHLSVVHAVVAAFEQRGMPARDLEMHMLFSIPVSVFDHDLDHPQYGRYNRQLGEFVDERWRRCTDYKDGSLFLNLEHIFIAQAAEMHVVSLQAVHRLDHYPDLAHTHDGEDRGRRNLFIVKRNV
ncbi:hypothetical protein KGQ72_02100 [Patescibacteria group bacterium]|nr:hypothetical protein [Patescibacteria group bacterium]